MGSLVLKDVSKQYGSIKVVDRINLTVQSGELIVLVGPSGCGKSTILRMIAGLTQVSSGEIVIADSTVNDIPPKDRDIAMVFQNYALYPHMTVFENMAFGLAMRKTPRELIKERVREAAAVLNITELLERRPRDLSGGQQQRVAVGRAIVRNPKLFLFDEPLSNLDAKLRVSMRSELIKLHKKLKATMIYVTHDQTEAMSLGNRLVVIESGVVQQVGTPQEIYEKPANRFVGSFIGSPPMNFIPARIGEAKGSIILSSPSLDCQLTAKQEESLKKTAIPDQEVLLGIRPEALCPDIEEASKLLCRVKVKVEFLESLGNEILATCIAEGVELISRVPTSTHLATDQITDLRFSPETIRIFNKETGALLV